MLIVAMLSKLRFRRKQDWKRILPVASVLMYNFGTMLLLSGPEIRMFYFVFTVTPVLLLLAMREDDPEPAAVPRGAAAGDTKKPEQKTAPSAVQAAPET